MTPRERVLAALSGDIPDRIPLTGYEGLLPRGQTERRLRNDGLAFNCRIGVLGTDSPNVTTEQRQYRQDGVHYQREVIRTPVGDVTQVRRFGGGYGTSLLCEFPIKTPDDYKVVEFMWRDQIYTPAYANYHDTVDRVRDDGVVVANLGYTPMQHMLILYMGPQRFAEDMVDRPDLFFGLYELMTQRHREQYEMAAESPAEYFEYGDNVTSEMVGADRFDKYVAPRYNEFAQMLHARGKKLGSHLDGMMRGLKDQVAKTDLDFIEAFAPYPDGDLPLAEARAAWPDKVIWINYPSAIHLSDEKEIEAFTRQMVQDVAPGDRFIVGITENIPDDRWQISMPIISRVLAES